MTEEDSDREPPTSIEPDGGSAPTDFDLLERVGRRLDRSARFRATRFHPEHTPDSLVAEYDLGYFPAGVERASLRVRWFENGDFNCHYSEQHASGEHWECRWDRHPNAHNSREHFHPTLDADASRETRLAPLGSPPPDAETPGEDRSYPTDWRDAIADVLRALDSHIEGLWE